MKRNAFTLVELIFVIVIIGVLAATAIPQFKNLKQNAEVKAMIKTTIDTASNAANAAVNQLDLENNASIKIGDLVSVTGKGWQTNNTTNSITYTEAGTTNVISTITLDTVARTVYYGIDCDNFTNGTSKTKCLSDLNVTTVTGVDKNATISF